MSAAVTTARIQRRVALPQLDAAGLLSCAVYLLFFGYGFASFTDPDYWWHLRTGRLIVDELSIPRSDVFSFTAEGQRWIVHEWLSEVLIYAGVSSAGYAATLGVFVSIILTSFALMQQTLRRLGTAPVAAVLLVTLAIVISLPYWTVRPQVLSWALAAVFISVLLQRERPPWLLVPAMALWANLHLGFLFGLAIAGMWLVARVWDHGAGERQFNWKGGALFVAACGAATLLNPNGPLLLAHALPFAPVVGSAVDIAAISEWSSPDFHEPMHVPLLAGVALLVALSLAGRVRDRFAALLAISFTLLALYTSRYQPLFAIAFLPAAGLAVRDWTALHSIGAGPGRTLNWAIVAVAAIAVAVSVPSLPGVQLGVDARSDGRVYYPEAALDWIERERPDANVFTMYEWGGYFINGLHPDGRVFIDGRADMYGSQLLADYGSIIAAKDGWQPLLERSGADTVVIESDVALASELQRTGGWRLAFRGEREAVFIRDGD